MVLFHTPRKEERKRENRVLDGRGQDVEREVLSGPLRTAQQLSKAGSIVQTTSL